jgi:diguanylate cyclase (GGDEF)-like protein
VTHRVDTGLSPRSRAGIRTVVGVLLTLLAVSIATLFPPLHDWALGGRYELLQDSIYLLASALVALRALLLRRGRVAWTLLAGGLFSYGLGNVLYYAVIQHRHPEPYPSLADPLWLVLYPTMYVAALLLARGQIRRWHASQWLDGLLVCVGTAALLLEFVLAPALAAATGSKSAVAVNLAYPAADLLLLVLVVAVFAVTGWRPGARWWLLGSGMALFAAADSIYLIELANDSFRSQTWLDVVWLVGVACMAISPWVRSGARLTAGSHEGVRLLAVPMLFGLAAASLLGWNSLHDREHAVVVTSLALVTIALALLRTSMSFREVRGLAEARRMARTDDLTDLPNRRRLLEQIDSSLLTAGSTASSAVLLIDMNRFRDVNDSFGHDVGDDLLRLISQRLRVGLPSTALLARMGGDEFGVWLPGADETTAVLTAATLRQALLEPFEMEGLLLHVDASTGVVMAPRDGTTSSKLLSHADVAMYAAKRLQTSHVVFDEKRHGGARERLETVAQFRAALDGEGLVLHYQPQINLHTGQPVGVEALLRWQHPERGRLYPDTFLGLAEHAGLMDRVVDRVLELALVDLQSWRREFPQLTVAVNLSASNLQDVSFPDRVMRQVHAAGVPPEALTLEITENVLMTDAARAKCVLDALRGQGFWLSVDDYGTGYCSLGYLRELPVQELKLDRSFVTDIVTDSRSAAIVRSTVDLSRQLGMQMVAEGVETASVLRLLETWGCDVAQGFHIARPMPAESVLPWLREAGSHRQSLDADTPIALLEVRA